MANEWDLRAAALNRSSDGKPREWTFPGRSKCECQAKIHELVGNCLSCGRVVCEQEGTGPCFFCGSKVPQTLEELARNKSKRSGKKGDQANLSQLRNAIALQRRLLRWDKEDIKKGVIDDQNEYYSTSDGVWLTNWEKRSKIDRIEGEKERRKEKEEREKFTLNFDLDGNILSGAQYDSESD